MTATIVEEQNCLMVSGTLNFQTIVALWKQSLPLLAKHASININLSQVTTSNSAGLALLIEWLKYGKRENKTVTFSNVPTQIQAIASVAGIDSMLMDI